MLSSNLSFGYVMKEVRVLIDGKNLMGGCQISEYLSPKNQFIKNIAFKVQNVTSLQESHH
jgi:hypothetical protein